MGQRPQRRSAIHFDNSREYATIFNMKAVKTIGCFSAVAAVFCAFFCGCSPARSPSNGTNQIITSQIGTNGVMENFQKPSPAELKQKLTPLQYEVTQHAATEPPFRNEFNANHRPGIYVDIVSGQPLFSSFD